MQTEVVLITNIILQMTLSRYTSTKHEIIAQVPIAQVPLDERRAGLLRS